MIKRYYPILVYAFIMALSLSFPRTGSLFLAILITYFGFLCYILIPVLNKYTIAQPVYLLLSSCTVAFISYGWASIVFNSSGTAHYLFTAFGIFLILTGIAGFVISVYELILNAGFDGIKSERLLKKGVFSVVRHPNTLSGIVFLVGLTMYYWSPGLLVTSPIWITGFIACAAMEEKFDLVPRFKNSYIKYCEATPGLLPNRNSPDSKSTNSK